MSRVRSRETLKGVEEDCQGALNPGWTRRKLGKEGTESGGWRRLITARDSRGGLVWTEVGDRDRQTAQDGLIGEMDSDHEQDEVVRGHTDHIQVIDVEADREAKNDGDRDGQSRHVRDGHVVTAGRLDQDHGDRDGQSEHVRDGLDSDHGHVVTAGRLADQDHEAKDDEKQVVIEEADEMISKDAEGDPDSDGNGSDEDRGARDDKVEAMKDRGGHDGDDNAEDVVQIICSVICCHLKIRK